MIQDNSFLKWTTYCLLLRLPIIIDISGTKSDLRISDSEDFVTLAEAKEMKQKLKAVALIECSAMNKQNVDDVFQEAIHVAIEEQLEPQTHFCGVHRCIIL